MTEYYYLYFYFPALSNACKRAMPVEELFSFSSSSCEGFDPVSAPKIPDAESREIVGLWDSCTVVVLAAASETPLIRAGAMMARI